MNTQEVNTKKKYSKPTVEVIELEAMEVIAWSSDTNNATDAEWGSSAYSNGRDS